MPHNSLFFPTCHFLLHSLLDAISLRIPWASLFPHVPGMYVKELLKRYLQEYPDEDLAYQEEIPSMHLLTADAVQRIGNLFRPITESMEDGQLSGCTKEFEDQAENLIRAFSESLGLKLEGKHSTRDFVIFSIEAEDVFENLRIPKRLPFLISPTDEISDEAIEHLRRLLKNHKLGFRSHIAVLILFCDNNKLNLATRRIANQLKAYAYDIVVVNHEHLLEVVSAKKPELVLLRSVSTQISLGALSPYTVTGPTPINFFFGREQELREITEHIETRSYLLIGGRRVGKTSIMNCLHSDRLPMSGFQTLFFDCETISANSNVLEAPLRDWSPDPPANAPQNFAELFLFPPHDKPLVLLLDEADKLIPEARKNDWQLFKTLRAMMNSKRLQVILSGERTLRDAVKEPGSPLFNFANFMLLGPLDYSAIHELITSPMEQLGIEIEDQDSVVNYIYEFTSGHPNIVQRLCSHLIAHLDKQGIRRISRNEVRSIIEDPHFQENDFLGTYWEGASALEKIITLVLSDRARAYRPSEVRQLIYEQAHILPSAKSTKDALDRLVELRSILKLSQRGYEFAIEAFPLILSNTITVEDLLEVLAEEYTEMEHLA